MYSINTTHVSSPRRHSVVYVMFVLQTVKKKFPSVRSKAGNLSCVIS